MNKFIITGISLIIIVLCIVIAPVNVKTNDQCIIGTTKKVEGIFWQGCFDTWHLSHVVLWFIIGCAIPGYIIPVLLISILWETIEHLHFKYNKICYSPYCGRIEDVFLNMLGYIIGSKCLI